MIPDQLQCTDMMGRKLSIPFPPQRIVSVVPSQTELLYDLGLDKKVIALTKFCVHPEEWFRNKKRVGGTKKLHLNTIIALQPDLIIANKEENTQAEIELLAKHFPVWISDISTVPEGISMIRQIGAIVGREEKAESLAHEIEDNFSKLSADVQPLRVAYFIWRNPWMSIGSDTFIHDMITRLGWQNVYAQQRRYPETSVEELKQLNPELILLSSEPYPFKQIHIEELKALLPEARILLVDGEMFSWYGSRMRLAVAYLRSLRERIGS